jgi:hypothetical protein
VPARADICRVTVNERQKNPTNFIGFLLTLEFSGDIIQEEINPSDLVGIKRAEVFGRLK